MELIGLEEEVFQVEVDGVTAELIGPVLQEVAAFPVTANALQMVVNLGLDRDIAKAAILVPLPMALMGKMVLLLPFITVVLLPPAPAHDITIGEVKA